MAGPTCTAPRAGRCPHPAMTQRRARSLRACVSVTAGREGARTAQRDDEADDSEQGLACNAVVFSLTFAPTADYCCGADRGTGGRTDGCQRRRSKILKGASSRSQSPRRAKCLLSRFALPRFAMHCVDGFVWFRREDSAIAGGASVPLLVTAAPPAVSWLSLRLRFQAPSLSLAPAMHACRRCMYARCRCACVCPCMPRADAGRAAGGKCDQALQGLPARGLGCKQGARRGQAEKARGRSKEGKAHKARWQQVTVTARVCACALLMYCYMVCTCALLMYRYYARRV